MKLKFNIEKLTLHTSVDNLITADVVFWYCGPDDEFGQTITFNVQISGDPYLSLEQIHEKLYRKAIDLAEQVLTSADDRSARQLSDESLGTKVSYHDALGQNFVAPPRLC